MGKKGVIFFVFFFIIVLSGLVSACVKNSADLNSDGLINNLDKDMFYSSWEKINCISPDWCGCSDINQDGIISISDFSLLASQYRKTSSDVYVTTFDYLSKENKLVFKSIGDSNFDKPTFSSEIHPFILYTNITLIKERITREPYKTWYNQIKTEGDNILSKDISGFKRIEKAKYSKVMGFLYAVTNDKKYGDKARDLLLNMGQGSYDKDHFEDVDGLVWFSESYDMLRGANYDFGNEKIKVCGYDCSCKKFLIWKYKCKTCYDCNKNIRGDLKGQMENVAETTIGEVLFDSKNLVRKNNLHIRRYSAVGIAAMAIGNSEFFNDAIDGGTTFNIVGDIASVGYKILTGLVGIFSRSTANKMKAIDLKYDGVSEVIDYQIVHNWEGGWAEGPYYMRYAFANTAMPFMKSLENTGLGNWLSTNKLLNLFDWRIRARMPNGALPPFDDSNIDETYFFNGYLNNELGNWDWVNSSHPYYNNWDEPWMLIDSISYYDNSIGQKEPDWNPTQFLTGAGQLIFRSDWGEEAVYLAFLGENGDAVDNGFDHEHIDSMSFILYAYGEYLAIDPGYIDWENREKVNQPKNHNVLLINERVSKESYAVDEDLFSTEYLSYGKITDNDKHTRSILFVDKKYFLVYDIIDSKSEDLYDLRIHGNGLEGTNSFRKEGFNGAEWRQDKAGLLTYVLTDNEDWLSFGKDVQSNSWGDVGEHTYMSVSRKSAGTGFLSVLYPSKLYPSESGDYASINEKQDKNGFTYLEIKKDDWTAYAFVNNKRDLIELEEVKLKTDASVFFVKLKGNEIESIFMDGVNKFYLGPEKIFESNNPTIVAVKFGNNTELYYKDNGDIEFYRNARHVFYNGHASDNIYLDGVISL